MQRSTVPTWAFFAGLIILLAIIVGGYFIFFRGPATPTPDTLPNASDLPGAR